VGSVLGQRKPLYRCIPEIHVTRLSVSGSLRPKVGLMLLLVVLVVSLCLLGVPLVTKVLVPMVQSNHKHVNLREDTESSNSFSDRLLASLKKETTGNLVFSPWLVQNSLACLATWANGMTKEQLLTNTWGPNCTEDEGIGSLKHKKVFFIPGQTVDEDVAKKAKELEKLDFRVKEAHEQINQWVRRNTLIVQDSKKWEEVTSEIDNAQMIIINAASVELKIENFISRVMKKFRTSSKEISIAMSRIDGEFLTDDKNLVVIDNGLADGLSLCLQLRMENEESLEAQKILEKRCNDVKLVKKHLSILLPTNLNITSTISLAPHLQSLGIDKPFSQEAEFQNLSTQKGLHMGQFFQVASLQLIFSQRGGNKRTFAQDKQKSNEFPELVFDHTFSFLVIHKSSRRTIIRGIYSNPNDDV